MIEQTQRTNGFIPISIGLAALVAVSGVAQAERVDVVTRAAEIVVPENARLHIDIPVGELEIAGTEGDQLTATMNIACDEDADDCAERAGRAEFVQEIDGQDVYLRVEPGGMNAYTRTHMRVHIAVPAAETLEVEFGAGELRVRDVDACTSVRMFAGEAQIHADARRVGEVKLKAMFGEAILHTDAASQAGKRPLLVGARVDWDEGVGDCRLKARLRFGEVSAHLTGS
jgi:hypothetical protein